MRIRRSRLPILLCAITYLCALTVCHHTIAYEILKCHSQERMHPDFRVAHTCEHCQRIVLRYEHFLEAKCRISLPHTRADVRKAIEDGCEMFRHFLVENSSFRGDEPPVFLQDEAERFDRIAAQLDDTVDTSSCGSIGGFELLLYNGMSLGYKSMTCGESLTYKVSPGSLLLY